MLFSVRNNYKQIKNDVKTIKNKVYLHLRIKYFNI